MYHSNRQRRNVRNGTFNTKPGGVDSNTNPPEAIDLTRPVSEVIEIPPQKPAAPSVTYYECGDIYYSFD